MRDRWEAWQAYAFILPSAAVMFLFTLYPALRALVLSLYHWDLIDPAHRFAGLGNYARLLHDREFWHALIVTAGYAAGGVSLSVGAGLGLALLLNLPLPGRAWLRLVYFLPFVTTGVAASMAWRFLLNDQYGLLNQLLLWLGLPPRRWLLEPALALPCLIAVSVWKYAGYAAVIFLEGLQNVDRHVLEAARVDGAAGWRLFARITWPLLRPITLFVSVTSLIGAFQVFNEVFVLFGPEAGPMGAATTAVLYIYRQAFVHFRMGYAAAANLLVLVIFGLTLLQFRLSRSGSPGTAL